MGLVYSQTDSGLVRADHGADAAAVGAALKQHDPELRLVPQESDGWSTTLWKVYRYAGSDRPAEFVTAWMTDRGEPLPLSMALLDEVQRLDRNTRGAALEAEAANAQLRAGNDKDFTRAMDDARDDWIPREEKGRIAAFHRSPGLAAARRRSRRRGENV